MHVSRDSNLKGMVLDSPFYSFTELTKDLVNTHTKIPSFIANMLRSILRKSILSKAGVDISFLKTFEFAKLCTIPALFVVAKGDDLVWPVHGHKLLKEYKCIKKDILEVEGDHNSDRPDIMFDSVSLFFQQIF